MMQFTNPLKIPLTELKWMVEGSGLMEPQVITNPRYDSLISSKCIKIVTFQNLLKDYIILFKLQTLSHKYQYNYMYVVLVTFVI